MIVHVKIFALLRDQVGCETIACELPERGTVGQLRSALAEQYPRLAAFMPHVLVAIDEQFAAEEAVVPPYGEVACIPPVSGG